MIIDYLGHSEFLVEIKNKNGGKTRILCDAWLSDYAVGDMMGRNPTFKIDYNKIGKIDAIYLSHSHTDHVDPYTIVELFQNLTEKPVILLPETMLFLVPILEKYIEGIEVIILKNKQEIEFNGVFIQGFVFETLYLTNEDDVMGIFISNEDEILFNEVDLVPPDTEEVHNYLYKVYAKRDYKNRIYIATRNELEGNLKILDLPSSKRKAFASEYKQGRVEEIEYEYYKHSEGYVDYKNIYGLKNFHKIFIGQGICYPKKIDSQFLSFQIMSLPEEVIIENKFARNYNFSTHIDYLKAGEKYNIGHKIFEQQEKIPYLYDFDFQEVQKNLGLDIKRKTLSVPMNDSTSDFISQQTMILDVLNNRFLPYWLANKEDCFKSLLLKSPDKCYRIMVRFGNGKKYDIVKIFQFHFGSHRFEIKDYNNQEFNEDYWANDVEDFINGKQELYSNFLHTLTDGKGYRLWMCLGVNYLNNDLLYNKFNLHFDLALLGKTSNDFVEQYYKKLDI
ncbi:MAG: MBL fold metallo-hydrolase [Candidatus Gracilibacteria bacterium]|nr:MBL fold metallo-hydrolase [Candidatus Gracilibacteria bacterium]